MCRLQDALDHCTLLIERNTRPVKGTTLGREPGRQRRSSFRQIPLAIQRLFYMLRQGTIRGSPAFMCVTTIRQVSVSASYVGSHGHSLSCLAPASPTPGPSFTRHLSVSVAVVALLLSASK